MKHAMLSTKFSDDLLVFILSIDDEEADLTC